MSTTDSNHDHDDSMVYEKLSTVEHACERFIELYREGLAPSIESFAAQHSELESQILELLPTVVMMEGARSQSMGRRKDGRVKRGAERIPKLGDYQIIREIGRGGMGIVYEAHQVSLDRRVAIKLLPKHMLDDAQVIKFQREASTAAKLHHTNIAPIYGIGESGGFHYFAMQLLDGVALDQFVTPSSSENRSTGGPLTVDKVVEIGAQIALALQYAHDEGVLHRDIKPANLLLDRRGNVWMTDFGLAITHLDLDAEAGTSASGTLRYMAPEKFDDVVGDVTGDVYALGVTLIELFTGRPAFASSRFRELTADIKSGNLQPLSHAGRALPHDLQAVLRKSVSIDPAHRYQTAAEMAADLNSFSQKRPVAAKRATLTGKVIRWIKRNPALTAASSLAAAFLIATTLISTTAYFDIQSALAAERDQSDKTKRASSLASEAMDKMFGQLSSGSELFDGSMVSAQPRPRLTSESAVLAKQLSDFYAQLASQDDRKSDLPIKAFIARSRVGELNERLGRYKDAAQAFQIAIRGIKKLVAKGRTPDSNENAIRIARMTNQLGIVRKLDNQPNNAQKNHQDAIDLLESRIKQNRFVDYGITLELARSYFLLETETRPGMGPYSFPPVIFSSNATAEDRNNQPGFDQSQRQIQNLKSAVALLDSIKPDSENDFVDAANYLLALCFRELANDDWSQRTVDDIGYQKQAVQLLTTLMEKYPNNPVFRYDLMRTLAEINVFDTGLNSETVDEAFRDLTEAREHGMKLVAAQPDVASYRLELIHCDFKISQIAKLKKSFLTPDLSTEQRMELDVTEEQSIRRALKAQTQLARSNPEYHAYRVWVARFALSLEACESMKSKPNERDKTIGRAESILNRLPKAVFDYPEVQAIEKEVSQAILRLLMENE